MFEEFEKLEKSITLKEKFSKASNNLLNHCFILKRKQETKQDYLFIREYISMFTSFFDLLNYDLKINEDLGLISIYNRNGTGRLQFNKFESIMFLIIKLLYLEKRNDLSSYDDNVIITIQDIRDKYAILKVRNKPKLDKQSEHHIIGLFKRYNILRNLSPDITLGETRIEVYPSILIAVPNEGINYLYESVKERLAEYEEGDDDYDETDEEAE